MFNEGFKNYQAGNWKRARKQFRQIESIKREHDTPTNILLEFMSQTNYEPPEDWKGYRYQKH